MTVLATLNVLLVGVWVGMYLFTTFVVSPAFKELFPEETTRSAHRRLVGRHYARVNGPLTALLLLVALALGLTGGFTVPLVLELAVLVLIGALVTLHVRRAGRFGVTPPAWITHLTLTASVLLCGLAALAHP